LRATQKHLQLKPLESGQSRRAHSLLKNRIAHGPIHYSVDDRLGIGHGYGANRKVDAPAKALARHRPYLLTAREKLEGTRLRSAPKATIRPVYTRTAAVTG